MACLLEGSGEVSDLIEIYRMTEISVATRCKLLIKAGQLINNQYASNITEPLLFELLMLLDSNHPMLQDKTFLQLAGEEK